MARKLVNLLAKYENKWVALSPDNKRVVASGLNVEEVVEKLKNLKKQGVLLKITPLDTYLSP